MNILIIGYGVVGKNIHKVFPWAAVHDPVLHKYRPKGVVWDVAFVCVPTPTVDGSCDTSIVEKVIEEHKEKVRVFCIRSTIPPGKTEEIGLVQDVRVVFSPEFYGETIHANGKTYDFIILGGRKEDRRIVAAAYKLVKHSDFKIIQTDSTTAELAKYMENCWLACKITFCNEFARIAEKIGVDYNELRELWLLDPRINRSHTWVFERQPYWDSVCLNKDIPAFIAYARKIHKNARLVTAAHDVNERHRVEKIRGLDGE